MQEVMVDRGQASQLKPENIDQLIKIIQKEFPSADIRITGRARTIRRQAELMAERIRANRKEFLNTYKWAPHIKEMDNWCKKHPTESMFETVNEFDRIIRTARARGAVVSNHLSDTARDISWPKGDAQQLDTIESRIKMLGARVIREPNAAGGKHWHVDR